MNNIHSIITLENYIGTYSIHTFSEILKPELSSQLSSESLKNDKYIMSKELHPRFHDKNILKTKSIFPEDFQKKHYVIIEFANIKINDSESVINFCNKYGLPISFLSQVVDYEDNESFYTVPDNQNPANYFHNHACMLLDEFYQLSSFCRHLLTASNKGNEQNIRLNRFSALLSLLLYSQYHYDNEYYNQPEIPLTPTGFICSALSKRIGLEPFSSPSPENGMLIFHYANLALNEVYKNAIFQSSPLKQTIFSKIAVLCRQICPLFVFLFKTQDQNHPVTTFREP